MRVHPLDLPSPHRDSPDERGTDALRDLIDADALVDDFLNLAEWLRDHGSRLRSDR